MDIDTAFDILELEKTADMAEIRQAYLDLAQIWHPDKFAHKPRLAEKAAAKMKEINCAYEVVQEHIRNNESSYKERPADEADTEDLFDFFDCINCGVTNRVSKTISYQNLRCGNCGKDPFKEESQFKNRNKCADESCFGKVSPDGRCDRCGRTIDEVKRENPDPNTSLENHHPWRRLFARTLDYYILSVLIIPLAFVLANVLSINTEDFRELVTNRFAFYVTLLILMIIYESIFISRLRTTPAKFLFGITIRKTSGQDLTLGQALSRAFHVLLQGMGLGIPFVAIFTQIFSYRRLINTGKTKWDEEHDCIVTHKKWSVYRSVLCTCTMLLVPGFSTIANEFGLQQATNAISVINDIQQPAGVEKQPITIDKVIHADGLNKQGITYIKHEKYKIAIEVLQLAIQVNPNFAEAWFNLGVAYINSGQYSEGINACQQSIRLQPENAYAWYNIGVAYKNMGRTDNAIEIYNNIKGIDPSIANDFLEKVINSEGKP